MNFTQFCRWISHHKALYKNYYCGFHNEIWEVEASTQQPKYLTMPC